MQIKRDYLLKDFLEKEVIKAHAGNALVEEAEVVLLADRHTDTGAWENANYIVKTLSGKHTVIKDLFFEEGLGFLRSLPAVITGHPRVKTLNDIVSIVGWENLELHQAHMNLIAHVNAMGKEVFYYGPYEKNFDYVTQAERLADQIELCHDHIEIGLLRGDYILDALSYVQTWSVMSKPKIIYVRGTCRFSTFYPRTS